MANINELGDQIANLTLLEAKQLADYLNLERTNMSKELGRMRDEGIIEYRKSHFKLLQPV